MTNEFQSDPADRGRTGHHPHRESAAVKISKSAANYTSDARTRHCEACTMFERNAARWMLNNACSAVKGLIAAHGHCRLWRSDPDRKPIRDRV